MVEIETKCYYKDGEDNVIGVEVIVYDGSGDVNSIIITNPDEINELKYKVNHLSETFIDASELNTILANTGLTTNINAKTLNGLASDKFLKVADKDNYSYKPKIHSSTNNDYGWGSETEYGHNKIIDNLTRDRFVNGESLAAHQGYELNKKIKTLEDNGLITQDSFHSHFNLMKKNGIVTLTIDDWDVNDYMDGETGIWREVFTIPDAFKPAIPKASNVKFIYLSNVFDSGNPVRVRVNMNTGVVTVRMDYVASHNFYSHITWIARE